ncbi:hypothetical protein B1B04_08980 [Lysinibacillus sp. KCTC 33748]|nr:hypothetical protein B1B04_08980 [Lysinibacillus sp. KCTC 33748]
MISLSSIGVLLEKFDPELRVVVLTNFHDVFFQRMELDSFHWIFLNHFPINSFGKNTFQYYVFTI